MSWKWTGKQTNNKEGSTLEHMNPSWTHTVWGIWRPVLATQRWWNKGVVLSALSGNIQKQDWHYCSRGHAPLPRAWDPWIKEATFKNPIPKKLAHGINFEKKKKVVVLKPYQQHSPRTTCHFLLLIGIFMVISNLRSATCLKKAGTVPIKGRKRWVRPKTKQRRTLHS